MYGLTMQALKLGWVCVGGTNPAVWFFKFEYVSTQQTNKNIKITLISGWITLQQCIKA